MSVSQSGLEKAIRYVRDQKKHHEEISFKNEYKRFLEKYEIEWDEKYFFG